MTASITATQKAAGITRLGSQRISSAISALIDITQKLTMYVLPMSATWHITCSGDCDWPTNVHGKPVKSQPRNHSLPAQIALVKKTEAIGFHFACGFADGPSNFAAPITAAASPQNSER